MTFLAGITKESFQEIVTVEIYWIECWECWVTNEDELQSRTVEKDRKREIHASKSKWIGQLDKKIIQFKFRDILIISAIYHTKVTAFYLKWDAISNLAPLLYISLREELSITICHNISYKILPNFRLIETWKYVCKKEMFKYQNKKNQLLYISHKYI